MSKMRRNRKNNNNHNTNLNTTNVYTENINTDPQQQTYYNYQTNSRNTLPQQQPNNGVREMSVVRYDPSQNYNTANDGQTILYSTNSGGGTLVSNNTNANNQMAITENGQIISTNTNTRRYNLEGNDLILASNEIEHDSPDSILDQINYPQPPHSRHGSASSAMMPDNYDPNHQNNLVQIARNGGKNSQYATIVPKLEQTVYNNPYVTNKSSGYSSQQVSNPQTLTNPMNRNTATGPIKVNTNNLVNIANYNKHQKSNSNSPLPDLQGGSGGNPATQSGNPGSNNNNPNSSPPKREVQNFIQKLAIMLEKAANPTEYPQFQTSDGKHPLIEWHGPDSFIIRESNKFTRDMVPAFFKSNKRESFIRQLNTYGFRKITNIENDNLISENHYIDEILHYMHPNFTRHNKENWVNIRRRRADRKDKEDKNSETLGNNLANSFDTNSNMMEIMEELRKLNEYNKGVQEQMYKLRQDNEFLKEQNKQLFERDRKNKNNIANVVHLLSKIMKGKKRGNYTSSEFPELMQSNSRFDETTATSNCDFKAIMAGPGEKRSGDKNSTSRSKNSNKIRYENGEPLEKVAKSPIVELPQNSTPPSIKEIENDPVLNLPTRNQYNYHPYTGLMNLENKNTESVGATPKIKNLNDSSRESGSTKYEKMLSVEDRESIERIITNTEKSIVPINILYKQLSKSLEEKQKETKLMKESSEAQANKIVSEFLKNEMGNLGGHEIHVNQVENSDLIIDTKDKKEKSKSSKSSKSVQFNKKNQEYTIPATTYSKESNTSSSNNNNSNNNNNLKLSLPNFSNVEEVDEDMFKTATVSSNTNLQSVNHENINKNSETNMSNYQINLVDSSQMESGTSDANSMNMVSEVHTNTWDFLDNFLNRADSLEYS